MKTVDVLVVGAGPAGLSSAINLASEGRSVILLEKRARAGGQAGTSALIENFLGHSAGFSGSHLAEQSHEQCCKFGVEIVYNVDIQTIVSTCSGYVVQSHPPELYIGRTVLLALGLSSRWLGVPGEDHPLIHHGMKMDALECPEGAHVVLVGGGNAAGQAALYYLDQGATVSIFTNRPIKQTMSAYLIERLHGRVPVFEGNAQGFVPSAGGVVVWVGGGPASEAQCVHILIGQEPRTDWLGKLIERDEKGYIVTDNQHKTSRPGVFAVGDVVSDAVRRVACAVGYGAEVVPTIHAYLEEMG